MANSNITSEQRTTDRDENLNGIYALIRIVANDVSSINLEVHTLRATLIDHIEKEEAKLQIQSNKLEKLAVLIRAFPFKDGEPDVQGHHDDHVTRMGEASEKKRRVRKTFDLVATIVIMGFANVIFFLLTQGLVEWLRHPAAPTVETIQRNLEPK